MSGPSFARRPGRPTSTVPILLYMKLLDLSSGKPSDQFVAAFKVAARNALVPYMLENNLARVRKVK